MPDIVGITMVSIGAAYLGYLGVVAWFLPNRFKKVMEFLRKFPKFFGYTDKYLDIFYDPTGLGLWLIRIITIPTFIGCIRILVFLLLGM
jgi:hypothetical protein